MGTEKSQPDGPPFQLETRLAEFLTEWRTRGFRIFLEPLNTNNRIDYWCSVVPEKSQTHIPIHTGQYSIVYVDDVTEVDVYSQEVVYRGGAGYGDKRGGIGGRGGGIGGRGCGSGGRGSGDRGGGIGGGESGKIGREIDFL